VIGARHLLALRAAAERRAGLVPVRRNGFGVLEHQTVCVLGHQARERYAL